MSKREELLHVAITEFSRYGYDSVGVQKIVDSAGVKKPTLYYYFGNKAGLLDALLDQYYSPFISHLHTAATYQGDVVKTLEDVTKLFFSFAKETKEIYLLMLSLQFAPKESEAYSIAKSYLDTTFNILVEMFLNFEKDHGNMKGRSVPFATSFRGILAAYITSFYSDEIELDDNRIYEVCRQFMYGIFS